MIRGAIFDMDGVLVDNVNHHVQAWKLFGKQKGRALTEEAIRATFGQRNKEMMEQLLERTFSGQEVKEYGRQKEELYRRLMERELETAKVPGLVNFLFGLQEESFVMAVATSGPEENVDFVLDGLQIRGCFQAVITGADVNEGKPHPEIFLLAAKKLALPPEQCVVFEDSSSGIKAARRAGCPCVAVATTHAEEELKRLSPARIIKDFTEIRAQEIGSLNPRGSVQPPE